MYSQEQPIKPPISNNSLYVGAGSWIVISSASLNYERRVISSSNGKLHLFGHVGAVTGFAFYDGTYVGGTFGATLLTGEKNSHFELSAGVATGSNESLDTERVLNNIRIAYPDVSIGYRYQKPSGGLVFRAHAGTLGLGIGLGYAF